MDWNLLLSSLLSPMLLAFALGVLATRAGSDLKFPEAIYTFLTIYLLVGIGLKGGYKLSITPFESFALPALAAILLSALIPVWSYFLLKKAGGFGAADAAAIAAHYGSVSAVTFSQTLVYLEGLRDQALAATPGLTSVELIKMGVEPEGYLPGLLALMEFPAILVALLLASRGMQRENPLATPVPFSEVTRELLSGKSTVLLVGFLFIGFVSGKRGYEQVSPLFDAPFRGVLTLFLLEAGLVTGRRLGELRKVGPFLIVFGILMPLLHAVLGIWVAHLLGMSIAGAMVLGTLCASASYIAAPAACRMALPEASPSYYLTASLAITFPFNLSIGIPLYHALATYLYRVL